MTSIEDRTSAHYRLLHAIFGEKFDEKFSLSSDQSDALINQIEAVLGTLSNMEVEIVTLRFGLESGAPMTHDEIAAVIGHSFEEVKDTEISIIEKLRHPARSQVLRPFLGS